MLQLIAQSFSDLGDIIIILLTWCANRRDFRLTCELGSGERNLHSVVYLRSLSTALHAIIISATFAHINA